MNVLTVRRSIPATTSQAAPLGVEVVLPGKYILGVSFFAEDYTSVSVRIMEGGGGGSGRLFPVIGGQVSTPGAPVVYDAAWFYTAGSEIYPVRIVSPAKMVTVQLSNTAALAAIAFLNLIVASSPPDETALELMREIKQGLDRYPVATAEAVKGLITAAVERQGLPR